MTLDAGNLSALAKTDALSYSGYAGGSLYLDSITTTLDYSPADPVPVPEPNTMPLMGVGLLTIGLAFVKGVRLLGMCGMSPNTKAATHAFLYTSSGIQDLGTVGARPATATALTTAARLRALPKRRLTRLCTPSSTTALCTTSTPSQPTSAPQFRYLSYAGDINLSGQIAGDGVTSDGYFLAFLATPIVSSVPELRELLIMAIGLLAIGVVARRQKRRG